MIETREPVAGGTKVVISDGDYQCSYTVLDDQREHEDALYRTPAKLTIERSKAEDVGAKR